MKTILGISAFYHDSAATILIDGKIIAAAQEERFTRKKHDPSYPFNAIEFVLDYANLKLNDVDQLNQRELLKMTNTMQHRGPDDMGYHSDENLSLGNTGSEDLNYSFLAKLFAGLSEQQREKIFQVLKNTRILEKTG